MGNIINLLREKGEGFTLKYFGIGDLGTENSAKVVIENYDIIKEYFSSKVSYGEYCLYRCWNSCKHEEK